MGSLLDGTLAGVCVHVFNQSKILYEALIERGN